MVIGHGCINNRSLYFHQLYDALSDMWVTINFGLRCSIGMIFLQVTVIFVEAHLS